MQGQTTDEAPTKTLDANRLTLMRVRGAATGPHRCRPLFVESFPGAGVTEPRVPVEEQVSSITFSRRHLLAEEGLGDGPCGQDQISKGSSICSPARKAGSKVGSRPG